MKKTIYTTLFSICCIAFNQHVIAQNVGGIWLSGDHIVSEGTGIHSGETPILALEDSTANILGTTGGGGGAGVGVTRFGDFKFRKALNANTVHFFQAVGTGNISSTLTFKFYRQKQDGRNQVYFTITLSNAIVSRHRLLSPECAGNNCPAAYEEIALFFNRIKYTDNINNTSIEFNVTRHL